jgi:urease accessory protein
VKTERFELLGHRSNRLVWLTCMGWLAANTTAQAHPGHLDTNSFATGLAHPMGGLDHLVAMLAVGLWAAQLGGRATWLVSSAVVGMVTVGAALGWNGVPLPFVEAGILASIVTLGLFLTTATRGPAFWCAGLVGVFALLHGHAHGTQIPVGPSGLAYALGLVMATGLLHLLGIFIGKLAQRSARPVLIRFGGAFILCTGTYLWLA